MDIYDNFINRSLVLRCLLQDYRNDPVWICFGPVIRLFLEFSG
jgi:hypothetical protein